jgi:hypothetical protein
MADPELSATWKRGLTWYVDELISADEMPV